MITFSRALPHQKKWCFLSLSFYCPPRGRCLFEDHENLFPLGGGFPAWERGEVEVFFFLATHSFFFLICLVYFSGYSPLCHVGTGFWVVLFFIPSCNIYIYLPLVYIFCLIRTTHNLLADESLLFSALQSKRPPSSKYLYVDFLSPF